MTNPCTLLKGSDPEMDGTDGQMDGGRDKERNAPSHTYCSTSENQILGEIRIKSDNYNYPNTFSEPPIHGINSGNVRLEPGLLVNPDLNII